MVNYVNYLEAYPNLERVLRDGANMHCSLSGGGLRVVIVKKDEQKLTYGEYPYFSGALAHAENDFGLDYEQQYGENAKHKQYLVGEYPLHHDAFDAYIKEGHELNIFYSNYLDRVVCASDIYPEKVIWGSGKSILLAILDCVLSGYMRVEQKDEFMKRVHDNDEDGDEHDNLSYKF